MTEQQTNFWNSQSFNWSIPKRSSSQSWCLMTLSVFALAVIVAPIHTAFAVGMTTSENGEGLVYVVTNDPVPNGNAILAYRRDEAGDLSPLPGSPFPTGGTGYRTDTTLLPHFGPFDLDQNIIVDSQTRRLFATHGGSDTIAVFEIRSDGTLICWIRVNKDGTRAYTTNNGDDTVSVYDLSDPSFPIEIQHLHLKGHGHPYQLALDESERFLHVVKHRTLDEMPVGDGSVINILEVQPDGRLEEVGTSPVTLPERDDLLARPQGVAAF